MSDRSEKMLAVAATTLNAEQFIALELAKALIAEKRLNAVSFAGLISESISAAKRIAGECQS